MLGSIQSPIHALPHTHPTTLEGGCSDYPHFIAEETEAQREVEEFAPDHS